MKLVLVVMLSIGCMAAHPPQRTSARIPYDIAHPAAMLSLVDELREVSALTDVDSNTVACLQDEQATVYFLSLKDGSIQRTFPFAGAADMEGLTRVGDGFQALRSDGLIYRLGDVASGLTIQDTFRVNIQNKDIEGLGYDDRRGLVLVSPKDILKGSSEQRDERIVYGMDPNDPEHRAVPVLKLSLTDLIQQAGTNGISTPLRTTEKGREVSALKLRYSSVAMHPFLDHYYLLSAADRTLLVVDRAGALIDLVQLDPALLPKPEGITFLENGDLLLSSEGKGSAPVLVRYSYHPKD